MSEIPDTVGIIVDQVTEMVCAQCGEQMDVSGMEPFSKVECPHCSAVNNVSARLGSFLLKRLLGKGGMGGVYSARDEALGRDVAIKVMLPEVGDDEEFVETFRREAQSAAKLNHPHIAQIYSFGQEKGQPYIVMELVPGKGLDKLMEEGPVDQALAMQVAYDIAEGLGQADEIGLLHGDIKPENILLDDKLNAKLVDFGIAVASGQRQEGIWGTPYYIAPEKVRRQTIDARSDIYSLGATLYHALSGQPPFDGDTPVEVVKARLDQDPRPLSSLRKNIHPQVEQVIQRMLQREAGRRYPTYASLMSDLKRAKEKLPKPKLGGKKIVVTGRNRKIRAAGANAQTGKTASRKIKVSAGATSTSNQSGLTGQHAGVEHDGALDEYKKRLTASGPSEADLARRARGRKRFGIFLLVLLIGGVVAGGGYMFWLHRQEVLQERRDAVELMDTQDAAAAELEKTEAALDKFASRVTQAATMIPGATNAVYILTGEPLLIDKEGQAAAAAAVEPAAAEAAPRSRSEQPLPQAVAEEEEKAEFRDDGMPAGMPTREELEARRRRRSAPPQEEAEQPEAEQPEAAPAMAEPAIEPDKVEEAVLVEEKEWALSIINGVKAAEGDLSEAQEAGVTLREAAAVIAKTAEVDVARVAKEKFDTAVETINAARQNAEKSISAAEELYGKLDARRIEEEKKIEARRKAEEEAERLRQEAEEQRRAEEARQRKIEAEKVMIESLLNQVRVLAKSNDFAAGLEMLKNEAAKIETKPGKERMDILIKRYERLVWMKSFLIKQLDEDPMKWGIGIGPSSVDVTGANEKVIRHRGGILAWNAVSIPQMLKFIDHYRGSRNIRVREQAELNFAGAIFCYENAEGSSAALDRARDYANRTVRAARYLEEEVRKLVPAY